MNDPIGPVEIFFSYSHRDEDLRDLLAKHLAPLKRDGLVQFWHDRRIGAGDDWAGKINEHLESADIILLLISSEFMASDYCHDLEMTRALERHDAGEAIVVPVILRPCDWQTAKFARLQALPRDAKAVTTWDNHDSAFTEVAQGLRQLITQRAAALAPGARPATAESTTAPTSSEPNTEHEGPQSPSRQGQKTGNSGESSTPHWKPALGLLVLLALFVVGLFRFLEPQRAEVIASFDKAEQFIGRLHLERTDGTALGVNHRFQTKEFVRFRIESNRGGWVYVFHRRPAADELTLLWPEDPDEDTANVVRAHTPLIVPTGDVAIKFTEETGDEFFYVAIMERPKTPTPGNAAARRVEESRSAARSFGGRRNVVLARPEPSDPDLYFKPADDGQIAAIKFSLLHEN